MKKLKREKSATQKKMVQHEKRATWKECKKQKQCNINKVKH